MSEFKGMMVKFANLHLNEGEFFANKVILINTPVFDALKEPEPIGHGEVTHCHFLTSKDVAHKGGYDPQFDYMESLGIPYYVIDPFANEHLLKYQGNWIVSDNIHAPYQLACIKSDYMKIESGGSYCTVIGMQNVEALTKNIRLATENEIKTGEKMDQKNLTDELNEIMALSKHKGIGAYNFVKRSLEYGTYPKEFLIFFLNSESFGGYEAEHTAFEAWKHQQDIIESHEHRRIELVKQNQKLHIKVANLEMQIHDAIEAFDNLHSESLKDDVRDIIKPFISDDLHE